MTGHGVRLQYTLEAHTQAGARIDNPLFDLLAALQAHGSIRHAAQAMGASYRHVWGALKHWEQQLQEPLVNWVQGQPATLTPYARRLLWAEQQARVRMTPHIEALRAELEHVLAQAHDGRQQVLDVFASHDPVLAPLRALAADHRLHLRLHVAGSVDALRALATGRGTVAGFHLPALPAGSPVYAAALAPLLEAGRHHLIGCFQRTQGLMLRPGAAAEAGLAAVTGLADLAPGAGGPAARRLRFVNRQPGAGTRLLMEHLLHEAGMARDAVDGWLDRTEETQVAVAATIAHGDADVGPGTEAVARLHGLDYVPLVAETYHLVCRTDALDSPAVTYLRMVLDQPEWPQALAQMPGLQPAAQAGEALPLERALPWWPQSAAGARP